MFQRVWRQNLSSKSLRLSCTSIKTFSVWEQFETYLAFKVPERWATRLNRVARWHHLAIEHCREKLGPNKRTMCVFGHRDNQILNSPGVCAADSWSHQKPIGRKKKGENWDPTPCSINITLNNTAKSKLVCVCDVT